MITFNLHIFKYILLYENLLFLFNNMIFFLKWINKIKGNRSFYFVLFVNLIVHLNIQVFSRSYISSFPNNNRYCNHATSHANSKAFGLLRRGLAPYSMWVVLGSYEFEDLRTSSSQASPYKERADKPAIAHSFIGSASYVAVSLMICCSVWEIIPDSTNLIQFLFALGARVSNILFMSKEENYEKFRYCPT